MKYEQRHRIAQKVVETFRSRAGNTHADLLTYPLSLDALTVVISETYPIAVHQMEGLDIRKVARAVEQLGGSIETNVLDQYVALAGFLYAHRGGGLIFIERGDTEERRKFTLAHELGHFINEYYEPVYLKYEASNTLPLFSEDRTEQTQQVVAARCSPADIHGEAEPIIRGTVDMSVRELVERLHREQRSRFSEIRANLFAAELLMPMEECARVEHENEGASVGELIAALIKRFGVSRSAAAIRVEELRLGIMEERLL
jgi:Zn-dependent peptidase ImmA (M78 family)